MDYEPRPIRTDTIRLADEIGLLVERLAEHIHDVWACGRHDQGWRYGVERNDTLKTHPCLISYAALSDNEKDFDRATVVETLKAITAFGYRIVSPDSPSGRSTKSTE